MIVTESFVWINYPKSGSTFVRQALRQLYKECAKAEKRRKGFWRFLRRPVVRHIEELRVPELRLPKEVGRAGKPTPHGTVSQIPECYRHLPVVSSIREPIDRLRSGYVYADWKREDVHLAPLAVLEEFYPGFPEIGFREFVEMTIRFGSLRISIGGEPVVLGPLSGDLLKFFSRRPIDPEGGNIYRDWDDFADSLAQVRFLKQESLSEDLADLLVGFGFAPAEVSFIKTKERVNKARVESDFDDAELAEIRALVADSDPLLGPLVGKLLGFGGPLFETVSGKNPQSN